MAELSTTRPRKILPPALYVTDLEDAPQCHCGLVAALAVYPKASFWLCPSHARATTKPRCGFHKPIVVWLREREAA